MIRSRPIRLRLAAAFTVMMALVLTGVALVTLAHAREALDESISDGLVYRLRDLQRSAGEATLTVSGGGRDRAEQILDPAGRLLASSREVAGGPMLAPAELAAAGHGWITVEQSNAGALLQPVRIAAAPTGQGSRIAVAAVSLAARDAAVADLAGELVVAFPLVLAAAAVGAYLLAASALRPVERMRARAAVITAEDPEQRLPVPAGRDEITRLGVTFNDLLGRLQAALSRERQFVADASHELRTPLSLLTTELELALQRPRTHDELTAALHSALEETGRLSRLTQDLLLLARTDQAEGDRQARQAGQVELRPLLVSIAARYRAIANDHDLSVDCPSELAAYIDNEDLDRVVSNLLDNAFRHGASPVTVRARPTDTGGRGSITIAVRDHGPGLAPDFLNRAFDRFTRGDAARTNGGTGLGLAITAALALRNRGQVIAANHDDGGAVFTFTLPADPVPTSTAQDE